MKTTTTAEACSSAPRSPLPPLLLHKRLRRRRKPAPQTNRALVDAVKKARSLSQGLRQMGLPYLVVEALGPCSLRDVDVGSDDRLSSYLCETVASHKFASDFVRDACLETAVMVRKDLL